MILIDEIEAAAKRCRETGWNGFRPELDALSITTSKWWPVLKAALLAGKEMEKHSHCANDEFCQDFLASADRFRAATEGTDAAAIGKAS